MEKGAIFIKYNGFKLLRIYFEMDKLSTMQTGWQKQAAVWECWLDGYESTQLLKDPSFSRRELYLAK